ncbi:hypothetical protein M231_04572 [Tremella mesenterica]|uniref:Uncharacterized protein n=1 Tax=Tremella mesenterica TaxID=5217 RepID=A0A4Q1BK93_TREME|nr:hypothetical protein M231_04572 [Tremella mesenterica]
MPYPPFVEGYEPNSNHAAAFGSTGENAGLDSSVSVACPSSTGSLSGGGSPAERKPSRPRGIREKSRKWKVINQETIPFDQHLVEVYDRIQRLALTVPPQSGLYDKESKITADDLLTFPDMLQLIAGQALKTKFGTRYDLSMEVADRLSATLLPVFDGEVTGETTLIPDIFRQRLTRLLKLFTSHPASVQDALNAIRFVPGWIRNGQSKDLERNGHDPVTSAIPSDGYAPPEGLPAVYPLSTEQQWTHSAPMPSSNFSDPPQRREEFVFNDQASSGRLFPNDGLPAQGNQQPPQQSSPPQQAPLHEWIGYE